MIWFKLWDVNVLTRRHLALTLLNVFCSCEEDIFALNLLFFLSLNDERSFENGEVANKMLYCIFTLFVSRGLRAIPSPPLSRNRYYSSVPALTSWLRLSLLYLRHSSASRQPAHASPGGLNPKKEERETINMGSRKAASGRRRHPFAIEIKHVKEKKKTKWRQARKRIRISLSVAWNNLGSIELENARESVSVAVLPFGQQ